MLDLREIRMMCTAGRCLSYSGLMNSNEINRFTHSNIFPNCMIKATAPVVVRNCCFCHPTTSVFRRAFTTSIEVLLIPDRHIAVIC